MKSDGSMLIGRGPCSAEAIVLGELRAQMRQGADAAELTRPLRVVVPSAVLRLHLLDRITAELGPAVVGLSVHTLSGLAQLILSRAGVRPIVDAGLFEVLARREAARHAPMTDLLGQLEDGLGLVAASARDFLSAGFVCGDRERVEAVIREVPEPAATYARCVARVAAGTQRALRSLGVSRPGDLLVEAARCLAERGAELLPSRGILVHGFSDATGQAVQLLAGLQRCGARIIVDLPPDPVDPRAEDAGGVFARRLVGRLAGSVPAGSGRDHMATVDNDAVIDRRERVSVQAVGVDAEVGEVAHRVAELCRAGVDPEGIGVVARDLARYLPPLRVALGRRGVPYRSLPGPWQAEPVGRRWAAVLEVLDRGSQTPVERWLDATAGGAELRLGLRVLGVGRLGELASLDVDQALGGAASLPLPVREGFVGLDGGDEAAGQVARRVARRRLPGAELRDAVVRARRAAHRLEDGAVPASSVEQLRWLEALLRKDVRWDCAQADLKAKLRVWSAGLPEALMLERSELIALLRQRPLIPAQETTEGSGIWVLDMTHARGMTFEHLFAIGLNRGVFPRTISEDALLADAVRKRLREVLPDLPLKGAGYDEESYLFAQLLASARARVTLSWQSADDDGRPMAVSPLVQRLVVQGRLARVDSVPQHPAARLLPPWAGTDTRPRTADELARLAALGGPRAELEPTLTLHHEQMGSGTEGPLSAPELARAGLRVLDELAPDRRTAKGRQIAASAGPYHGLVGVRCGRDPRDDELYITTLEKLAACPWQTLLRQVLRIEPLPDVVAVPQGISRQVLGITVHRALQQLVAADAEIGRDAAACAEGPTGTPVRYVARPSEAAIGRVVAEAARAVARHEGVLLPGLREALAQLALPYVRRAVALDWPTSGASVAVVAAEVERRFELPGVGDAARSLPFRVDRIDLRDDMPVMTDFKIGAPIATVKKEATRQKRFAEEVRAGRRLQVAVYAACDDGPRCRARYLFLSPSLDEGVAVWQLDAESETVTEVLPEVLSTLIRAWDGGVFVPRLEDGAGDEPRLCSRCEVAEACLRGDSEARRRLRAAVDASRDAAEEGWAKTLGAVWQLGSAAKERKA